MRCALGILTCIRKRHKSPRSSSGWGGRDTSGHESSGMASERLYSPRYLRNKTSGIFEQNFHEDVEEVNAVMEEDHVLRLLMEAFPRISLETLARAYARANGNPNVAGEILTIESLENSISSKADVAKTEERPAWHANAPTALKVESPRNGEYLWEAEFEEKRFIDEYVGKFGLFSETVASEPIQWDDNSRVLADTHQLKNGHGDFSGASVWREPPVLGSEGTTAADSGLGTWQAPVVEPEAPGDRVVDDSCPFLQRTVEVCASNKLSANASVYECERGQSSTKPLSNNPTVATTNTQKLYTTGSVSSPRHKRIDVASSSDFSGESVWRESPVLKNEGSSAPDSSREAWQAPGAKPEAPGGRTVDAIFPVLQRTVEVRAPSKLSANAPVYEFTGGLNSTRPRLNNSTVATTNTHKLYAITGSVSSQRQRRMDVASSSGSANAVGGISAAGGGSLFSRQAELDYGLYSGNFGKKKKVGNGAVVEKFVSEGGLDEMAVEGFLYSMFDGEIGLDVVRDVLGHFAGDTTKAMETLLVMGSSGFIDNGDSDDVSGHSHNGVGHPEDGFKNGEEETLHHNTELSNDQGEALNRNAHLTEDILVSLHATFPAVERSSLAEILQVAKSYEEAVAMLKESGLKPIGEPNLQPKLDPNEVLRSLFRSDPEEEPETHTPPSEPWTVVVSKPRIRRALDMEAKVELLKSDQLKSDQLKSDPNGDWNDYTRHRTSATEHWTTMKKYMKEAAAAYGRGDRHHASILSEKGFKFKKLAQEASSRASQNIFNVQNKDIENNITIDLHSQHVTESLKLLKLHLRSLSQIHSVQRLTVITGQGTHSNGGKAKIKPSLVRYLKKKNIPWVEVNAGCILIDMDDVRALECDVRSSGSGSDDDF